MKVRIDPRRLLGLPLLGIGLFFALWGGIFAVCLALFVVDELKHGGWEVARHTMPDLATCLVAASAGGSAAWLAVRLLRTGPSDRKGGR